MTSSLNGNLFKHYPQTVKLVLWRYTQCPKFECFSLLFLFCFWAHRRIHSMFTGMTRIHLITHSLTNHQVNTLKQWWHNAFSKVLRSTVFSCVQVNPLFWSQENKVFSFLGKNFLINLSFILEFSFRYAMVTQKNLLRTFFDLSFWPTYKSRAIFRL